MPNIILGLKVAEKGHKMSTYKMVGGTMNLVMAHPSEHKLTAGEQ